MNVFFPIIEGFPMGCKNHRMLPVYRIMQGARARWRIENETFNTLKNQGYHFEHNFGHGYEHLSVVFATLMMLAFLARIILKESTPRGGGLDITPEGLIYHRILSPYRACFSLCMLR